MVEGGQVDIIKLAKDVEDLFATAEHAFKDCNLFSAKTLGDCDADIPVAVDDLYTTIQDIQAGNY